MQKPPGGAALRPTAEAIGGICFMFTPHRAKGQGRSCPAAGLSASLRAGRYSRLRTGSPSCKACRPPGDAPSHMLGRPRPLAPSNSSYSARLTGAKGPRSSPAECCPPRVSLCHFPGVLRPLLSPCRAPLSASLCAASVRAARTAQWEFSPAAESSGIPSCSGRSPRPLSDGRKRGCMASAIQSRDRAVLCQSRRRYPLRRRQRLLHPDQRLSATSCRCRSFSASATYLVLRRARVR